MSSPSHFSTAPSLLPRPRSEQRSSGTVTLNPARISSDAASAHVAEYLRGVFFAAAAIVARGEDDSTSTAAPIFLSVAEAAHELPTDRTGSAAEAFTLDITEDAVTIVGGSAAGVFYGAQALLQLLPPAIYRRGFAQLDWRVPVTRVTDAPTFPWRGVMLDVVRHFRTVPDVLRLIDQLAAHRMNRLHLHLTDDQGWRVEIRRYPRLTEVGSWRTESQVGAHVAGADGVLRPESFDGRPHGGYYTQDDIREIVAYAASRFVTVVPEIETPGHVRAALAAYPELGVTGEPVSVWTEWGISEDILNTDESTIEFFINVFDEVMELFPSKYIGVGGDECPKVQWKQDPRTQERMRSLGLDNEEQLQAWMVRRFADHLERSGRTAIGWDEILEGDTMTPSATVLSWRGLQGAVTAARRGHDVVSSPDHHAYLDFRQSDADNEPIPVAIPLTPENVYAFAPVPDELTQEEAAHVLGGQGNMWTEHVDTTRRLDYMLFPRVSALAEALWSADTGRARDYAEFADRLDEHLARLDAMGIAYRRSSGPRPWEERPGIPGRPMSREELAAQAAELTANIAV